MYKVQVLRYGWEKCQAVASEKEARRLADEWHEAFRMRRGSAELMAVGQEGCNSPGNPKGGIWLARASVWIKEPHRAPDAELWPYPTPSSITLGGLPQGRAGVRACDGLTFNLAPRII